MKSKKYAKQDLKKQRFTFILIGLVMSLLVTNAIFGYTSYDEIVNSLGEEEMDEEIEVQENTVQEKKPPPPPPPPELEIVEDEEIIPDTVPKLKSTEDDGKKVQQKKNTDPPKKKKKGPIKTDEVLNVWDVSKNAEFKDGGKKGLMKFLAENVKYPDIALEQEIEGRVTVKFTVTKTGEVKDLKLKGKKLGYGLEEEAIRVVRLTSGLWNPAMQRADKPANVYFSLPIVFKLD